MKTTRSDQFGCPCIVIEPGDTAAGLVQAALEEGAVYQTLDGDMFVAQFADGPIELHTGRSLEASARKMQIA